MRQCLHPVYGSSRRHCAADVCFRRPGHHSHEEMRLRSDSLLEMNNDKKARGRSMNSGDILPWHASIPWTHVRLLLLAATCATVPQVKRQEPPKPQQLGVPLANAPHWSHPVILFGTEAKSRARIVFTVTAYLSLSQTWCTPGGLSSTSSRRHSHTDCARIRPHRSNWVCRSFGPV